MNKLTIVNALVNASIYTINEDEFIDQIIAAGVTSYVIDIYSYKVTFKENSLSSLNSKQTTEYPISIPLIKKDNQGEPLMVLALKQADITSYEVFLPEMRMVFMSN